MKKIKNTVTALFTTLFVLAVVTSCQEGKKEADRVSKGGIILGNSLKINETEGFSTLYPAAINSLSEAHIATQVHAGLVRFHTKTLELKPDIAESWKNDEAETTYTFSLKKGVYFHDCEVCKGREVKAQDFKYSFELLCKNEENNKNFASTFKDKVVGANEYFDGSAKEVSGIKALDDYTLEIQLTKPNNAFLYMLASVAASVVCREAVEKNGTKMMCGAGPFKFSQKDGKIVLTRHKKYHRSDEFGNQMPYLDEIVISSIPNKDQEIEAFFKGDLDIIQSVNMSGVRSFMESNIKDFQGKDAKYVMVSSGDLPEYDMYTIYQKKVKGHSPNFMNFRDYSVVYIQDTDDAE